MRGFFIFIFYGEETLVIGLILILLLAEVVQFCHFS